MRVIKTSQKRPEVQAVHPQVAWETAMRPGKHRALDKTKALGQAQETLEQVKAACAPELSSSRTRPH